MIVKAAVPQQIRLRIIPDIRSLIFGGKKEIHYIGGTDVLPPPLEGARETEVIQRLGTEACGSGRSDLYRNDRTYQGNQYI